MRAYQVLRRWLSQVCDPIRALKGVLGYARFLSDWHRYAEVEGTEPIRLIDTYPQVHDRTDKTPFDAHYLYVNNWAFRRILATAPLLHIDVGSQTIFASLLSGILPVVFVDYRPLDAKLDGLWCLGGSLLALPFADRSVSSLSCLHVAEHIGLGRYGDPLDPDGTRKACRELARVLAPGGNLFFAVPVGRPRLCFNAHRVHAAETVCEYFAALQLIEFSGVHDDGRWVERVDLAEFRDSDYACGMFWFQRQG